MSKFNTALEPSYKGLTEQILSCYQRQESCGAIKNEAGLVLPGEIYSPDTLSTSYNILLCINFYERKKCFMYYFWHIQ